MLTLGFLLLEIRFQQSMQARDVRFHRPYVRTEHFHVLKLGAASLNVAHQQLLRLTTDLSYILQAVFPAKSAYPHT